MNGCVFKRKLPSGRITWNYAMTPARTKFNKR